MPKPLNLLILEDNSADVELLLIKLRQAGFEPDYQMVDNKKDYTSHLKPVLDLIVSDYQLPQFNGLEALQLCNESGLDIPFIIVSGEISEEIAVECMRKGAADYLMKDRLGRLGTAVENAIEKKALLVKQKKAQLALLNSKKLLSDTGRIAKVGGWNVNAKTLAVSWTEETYRIHETPLNTMPNLEEAIDYFHPDDRPKLETAIKKGLEHGEPYDMELRFVTAKGNHLWVHTSCKPIIENGKIVSLSGTILDITNRKQVEKEISTLLDLSRKGSSETNLNNLLFYITKQITEVISPAEAASIFFYHEESKVVKVQAWEGFNDNDIRGLEFKVEDNGVGAIFRTKKPLLICNTSVDSKFKMLGKNSLDRVKSQIAVPLIFRKRVFGLIFADNLTRTDAFSQKDLNLLESIGNQLAGVIANKRLHNQLQGSKEFLANIFDAIQDGISVLDTELTITATNKWIEKKYSDGMPLIGKKCYQVYQDRKSICPWCPSKQVLKDGKQHSATVPYPSGENPTRWIEISSYPLEEPKGKITGVIEYVKDITERFHAKQEILKERDKAQKYLNIAEVMIITLNKDGDITLVNQKGARILGYTAEKLIGKNWFSTCLPARDRKRAKKIHGDVMDNVGELGAHYQQVIVTKSGKERIISWHSTPLWEWDDDEKHITGSLSSGEDITKREIAERALTVSEARFRQIIENSTNMFYSYAIDGQIEFVSPQSKKILGYEPEEMKVKWANLTSDNPINEKNLAIRQKAFETGAAQPPYELELIGKKGNRIWVEVHDAPVVQEDKILMMVGAITDITQRVHSRDLMNAVNQASVSVASAQTHQEIFNAVAGAVKKHDITCMLFMLDETQSKLTTKYMNYEPTLQTAAGKILGIKHADFSFPVEAVDEFQEVIREKKTIFIENSEPVLQKLFPKISKKLIAQVIKTLHIQNNIFAPLKYENRVYGIFSMQSNFFTQEHVPTATAFSDQLSAAWKKIELLQNLKKTLEGAIDTIAATIESRDPYTAGHQKRVSDLSAAIASEMKLTEMQVEGVKTAGTIHDLGKIKTPAEILSKPGGLSELEFNLIKTHPQNGFDLLKKIEFPWPIAEMILQHHERMDGSGYPRGLKGDEILLEARILAVADIVEAMSSHRPYRPALGIKKALEQIKKDKGTLLDPDVVDACLKTFEDGYELI